MRILIDLQACQSLGSRDRGIGRYSLALAQAMARNAGSHQIHLLLNAAFADSVGTIRQAFAGLIPPQHIHLWQVPEGHYDWTQDNWFLNACEKLRLQAIAELQPDVVHISSLFEGLGDKSVTSVIDHPHYITAVTLYDLIPLIYASQYLTNQGVQAWYYRKLQHLKNADLLLSISDSSRQEGIDYLGADPVRLVNISSAVDNEFFSSPFSTGELQQIREKYQLRPGFLMYTGGEDVRKNIENLVRAYAALPQDLRQKHQLAIICKLGDSFKAGLLKLLQEHRLTQHDVVLTGFVPDQDLPKLYQACHLFVFPSWHEGFGLPALEAMASGAVVIAANTSSLPEVMGNEAALFDPHSITSIRDKLVEVLSDPTCWQGLRQHGQRQAQQFSWDKSAIRALEAMQQAYLRKSKPRQNHFDSLTKPRLAYVSPVAPATTGIADYSAELLPELAKYYQIEIIAEQLETTDPWIKANFPIRELAWFEQNAKSYQRVLYHFGNSAFHCHMPQLLRNHPGVVVLHDFFLSGLYSHLQYTGISPTAYFEEIYSSYGWLPLIKEQSLQQHREHVWQYPCSRSVIEQAFSLIVHANYNQQLLEQHYPDLSWQQVNRIPHLRRLADSKKRQTARQELGLQEGQLLVCAFGMLGQTKCNRQLIEAWAASGLAKTGQHRLVFVGQVQDDEYCRAIQEDLQEKYAGHQIQITGYASADLFKTYLAAADIAVQLRTLSRGETSGTVLDCLAHGLATIVNANGSMAELDNDALEKMPDQFSPDELRASLCKLAQESQLRQRLSVAGRALIAKSHAPWQIAQQYHQAIEAAYQHSSNHQRWTLLEELASQIPEASVSYRQLLEVAHCLAQNRYPAKTKSLYLDVTILAQSDAASGIQRVVKSILHDFMTRPPQNYRVEPVILSGNSYKLARRFVTKLYAVNDSGQTDLILEPQPGDIFLGLDLNFDHLVQRPWELQRLKNAGVAINFIVYDLLPVLYPAYFADKLVELFSDWLKLLPKYADRVIGISRTVEKEWVNWLKQNLDLESAPDRSAYFHLGADRAVNSEVAVKATSGVANLPAAAYLLMVGTIEPRKAHSLALDAFEQLWANGSDLKLVIVGKNGWKNAQLIQRLQQHPEIGRRLHWLSEVDDANLQTLYQAAAGLLFNSEAEGFGLPIIEAAHYGIPLVLRDIEVFREVAGNHAYYYDASDAQTMATGLQTWYQLVQAKQHPTVTGMPYLNWQQSREQLWQVMAK